MAGDGFDRKKTPLRRPFQRVGNELLWRRNGVPIVAEVVKTFGESHGRSKLPVSSATPVLDVAEDLVRQVVVADGFKLLLKDVLHSPDGRLMLRVAG